MQRKQVDMSKASKKMLLEWTSKAKQCKLKHATHASKAKRKLKNNKQQAKINDGKKFLKLTKVVEMKMTEVAKMKEI